MPNISRKTTPLSIDTALPRWYSYPNKFVPMFGPLLHFFDNFAPETYHPCSRGGEY